MKRLLAVASLFLLCPSFVRAADPIYISEIAWAGSSLSTADEWFELCGPPGMDLSGWMIEGAATSALTLPVGSVVPESGAFLISNYGQDDPKTSLAATPSFVTTAVALSNANLFLTLRDAGGAIVDVAGASGTAPFAGTSGSVKTTMERLWPLMDGGSSSAWASASGSVGFDTGATERGTPGVCPVMMVSEPADGTPEVPGTETVPGTFESAPPAAPTSALRISEIYPSPNSGEKEWIELVNPSAVGEVLDGWTIEDGKGTSTTLAGAILPWSRIVIESPKGQLNNGGDLVVLKDASGRVLDGISYGDWDSLYPHIGEVGKGESVIRLELQDAFAVTTSPTPGNANVLVRVEKSSESSATVPNHPAVIQIPPAVIPSEAEEPLAIHASQAVSPLAALGRNDGKKETPAPLPKISTAKKPAEKIATPKSPYKGSAYTAVIAVPPGVYSKTRLYVSRPDGVQELRLSKSTAVAFATGQRISFVAQTKDEGGGAFLLANPNSIRLLDRSASSTFSTTRVTAEVVAIRAGIMEVRLDGVEADVLLPSAITGLKAGDLVTIEGFITPGARPRIVLPSMAALTLAKAAVTEPSSNDVALRAHLPWPLTAALTLVAAASGLLVYLRQERLKRLALVAQPIEEEIF